MLELEQRERQMFDYALEAYTGKPCDEAIDLISDEKIINIVCKLKRKRRKKEEVMIHA